MVTRIIDWRRIDVDLAGIGLLVLVAVAGYLLAIHSPVRDSLAYERARQQRDEALAGLGALRAECRSLRNQVDDAKRRREQLESTLPDPNSVGATISRIQELASRCGIVLTRLQPMGVAESPGYQVNLFQIAGKGSFPVFRRWLAAIESEVPCLDVTHFLVRASGEKDQGENTLCMFECTQKLYLSRRDEGLTALAKRP